MGTAAAARLKAGQLIAQRGRAARGIGHELGVAVGRELVVAVLPGTRVVGIQAEDVASIGCWVVWGPLEELLLRVMGVAQGVLGAEPVGMRVGRGAAVHSEGRQGDLEIPCDCSRVV